MIFVKWLSFFIATLFELSREAYLEMAMGYMNLGVNKGAIKLLEKAPSYPIIYYLLAYIYHKKN